MRPDDEMDYHAPNPDAKMKPKKFWAVTGKVKGVDLETGKGKWMKVAGTFDKKDQALAAALRGKEAGFEMEMFEGEVNWEPWVAVAKGDKVLASKIWPDE